MAARVVVAMGEGSGGTDGRSVLRIALARQILSLLLFLSPLLPPLAPSPLSRPYPLPLPLLRNSSVFLDALSFLLLRALLAFTLICNELLCL